MVPGNHQFAAKHENAILQHQDLCPGLIMITSTGLFCQERNAVSLSLDEFLAVLSGVEIRQIVAQCPEIQRQLPVGIITPSKTALRAILAKSPKLFHKAKEIWKNIGNIISSKKKRGQIEYQLRRTWSEIEDVLQEVACEVIGSLGADVTLAFVLHFSPRAPSLEDPDWGTEVWDVLATAVNRVTKRIVRRRKHYRVEERDADSLDFLIDHDIDDWEKKRRLCYAFLETLSPLDRAIWVMKNRGDSQTSIAKYVGKSDSEISRRLAKITMLWTRWIRDRLD